MAGQADALFVDERGDITILDWKRTARIRFDDNVFRSLKEPINHLPESNGYLYSLQLNIYKYMLESENGLRVNAMFLGQVCCFYFALCNTTRCVIVGVGVREGVNVIVAKQCALSARSIPRCHEPN